MGEPEVNLDRSYEDRDVFPRQDFERKAVVDERVHLSLNRRHR
jgi:hypothetical protein